ncbi:MAG: DUF4154 domain-containing protein [Bacteroidetes bacterium]|nr:DUF4154 domain-containing protein [Bacteroidota bacterium]
MQNIHLTKYLFIGLIIFFSRFICFGQDNDKIKATFIYNFTKYIDWPNQNELKEFSIGYLGSGSFAETSKVLLSNKFFNNNIPYKIKYFNSIQDIEPTQILYVNGDDGFDQDKIFNSIKGKGTLLVAENLEYFDKSMINFIMTSNNKQRFSLNQKVVEGEGFKINSTLLSLAILDGTGWKDVFSKFRELLKSEKTRVEVSKKDLEKILNTYDTQNKKIEEQSIEKTKTLNDIEKLNTEKTKTLEEIEKMSFQAQAKELKIKTQLNEITNNKLEAENKRQENELLKKEKEIQEGENKKQKIIIASVIGGLLVVILFSVFVFRSLYITRKQKRIIELQKTEVEKSKYIIEEKNKEITDSITYAKRIQQAKLPDRKDIFSAFPNSFVLYKPKDIVSGDFYFFHKNEQIVFIASADCTGHGVPGAFMSMIGSEKLDDALAHSADTSEILSHLNKGIKVSLHQTDSDESTRDGMDIALCSVDTDARVVKYAGANRPLWIIRNGQTVVEEIKATKKAIGGFTEDSQHFDTHEIKFAQGDTFYISTDGYADTFGGQEQKKVTTKRFKEILLSIQDKSLKEQEHYLDNFIADWKGGTEQVDDILVIGVRL